MNRHFIRLNKHSGLHSDTRFDRALSERSGVLLRAIWIGCLLSITGLGCANSRRLMTSATQPEPAREEMLTIRSNSDAARSGTSTPFAAAGRSDNDAGPSITDTDGHSLMAESLPPTAQRPLTQKEALDLVQARFDRMMEDGNLIPKTASTSRRSAPGRAAPDSDAGSVADAFIRWQQQRDAATIRDAVIAESVEADPEPRRAVSVETVNDATRSPFSTASNTAVTPADGSSRVHGETGTPAFGVSLTSPQRQDDSANRPETDMGRLENLSGGDAVGVENAAAGLSGDVLDRAEVLLIPGEAGSRLPARTDPEPTAPSDAGMSEDDESMFDRLRGLNFPENASEKIRRQIRKIPVPWSRRDDEAAPQTARQTAEIDTESSAEFADDALRQDSTDLLNQLIQQTEAELQAWPRSNNGKPLNERLWLQRQMDLRLLMLVAERYSDSIASPESVPAEHQEFLQNLMLAMAEYRDVESVPDDSRRSAQTMLQLQTAIESLRPLAPLAITRLEFCRRIHSFGSLETYPTYEFRTGQSLLLYAEIDGFHPELTPDGSLHTLMNGEIRIVRFGDNEPIDTIALPQIEDTTQTSRRDFFHSYELTLPAHLKAGRYSVHVRLFEPSTRRTATASVDFIIRK